jgi:hypothetical protein
LFYSVVLQLEVKNRLTLWTDLQLVNSKIRLSFEHKSCSLFSVGGFRIFIFLSSSLWN